MNARRTWVIAWFALFAAPSIALAVSVTGTDWIVHFNLPDQVSGVYPGEFAIRDALLARINALQTNDEATLATYTFSGNSASEGAAGPVLQAISNALARGVKMGFIADNGIDVGYKYWPSVALSNLAARAQNPLNLSQAPLAPGIMHDKLGAFRYAGTNQWVFVTSWNFTGGASTYQWNIALEVRNDDLYAAYTNEMGQMLAGHFHDDPAKSHAFDRSLFRLADSWTNGWVRFAPYPDGRASGNNAQTDITNLIGNAKSEIVFGLNDLTRPLIRDALIAAANRGVSIHGSMPKNDTDPGGNSVAIYEYLTNTTHYLTANIVHFVMPFSKADGSAVDTGEVDLIHEKWMVIDPWSSTPWLIHGSANWSDAALVSTNSNDENIVFVPHKDIARMFYAEFKRMTGTWTNRDDFWCDIGLTNGSLRAGLWMTDTNGFILQRADDIGAWTSAGGAITGFVGYLSVLTNDVDPKAFYRATRQ